MTTPFNATNIATGPSPDPVRGSANATYGTIPIQSISASPSPADQLAPATNETYRTLPTQPTPVGEAAPLTPSLAPTPPISVKPSASIGNPFETVVTMTISPASASDTPTVQVQSGTSSTTKNVTIAVLGTLLIVFIVLFAYTARQLTFAKRKLKLSPSTEPLLRPSSSDIEEKSSLLGASFVSNINLTDTKHSSPSTRPSSTVYDSPASLQRSQSTSTRLTVSSNSSSYPMATAVYVFYPTRPDEIPLRIGSRVRVIASFDDGWACISDDSGKRGMVPCECLDIFDDGSNQARSQDSDYDESEVWDNFSEVGKRLSNVTGISEASRLTGRTNFSERTTSLSFRTESSSATADFIWFAPGARSVLS